MVAALLLMLVALTFAALILGGCATFDPLADMRIEQEVKARLVAQKDAHLTRLGVVSNQGTVYLSGTVESAEERSRRRWVEGREHPGGTRGGAVGSENGPFMPLPLKGRARKRADRGRGSAMPTRPGLPRSTASRART